MTSVSAASSELKIEWYKEIPRDSDVRPGGVIIKRCKSPENYGLDFVEELTPIILPSGCEFLFKYINTVTDEVVIFHKREIVFKKR